MEKLSSMTQELRIVFAGTPQNAATTLSELHASGANIVGVLTREDAKVGKARDVSPSPVARVAGQLGIGIRKTNSVDTGTLEWLRGLEADLGVVVAYGAIFKTAVLEIPRLGWINLHYSLLPELPGPAPVQHALLRGLAVTGVTVFRLDEGVDTGPIISQVAVAIDNSDNASTLLGKLTVVGSELLTDTVLKGESSVLAAVAQSTAVVPDSAFKPTRSLARLDFYSTAQSLANKVRAMNPEPMAWFEVDGINIRVLGARAVDEPTGLSQAQVFQKELVVGCQEGSLVLELVQPAGKNAMSGADWFRGLRVEKLEIS